MLQKAIKFLAILLTTSTFFSTNVNADVRIFDAGGSKSILIDGIITPSDYQSFVEKASIVEKQNSTPFAVPLAVHLNSRGGNIETAMKIGKRIRNSKSYVVVFINSNDICASACVFILAGAGHRNVDGEVIIHRPYYDNDNATTAAKQKVNYKKIEKLVKAYLSEMNIPLSLYDEMLAISSDSGKLLTYTELKNFNLIGLDIYIEEATNASTAKKLHITKTELYERYNRLNVMCNVEYEEFKNATDETSAAASNYENCSNDVMNGVRK